MTIRTQTKITTAASSDSTVGTLAWANPTRVEANDGSYAEAANTSGATATSERCKCGAFGFSVPSDASILGLKSNVKVKGTGSGISGLTATSAWSASASSLNISKPSGTVEGDMLVLAHKQTNSGSPAASGFTLLDNDTTNGRQSFWYKVAGASEPASYTISSTSGSQSAVLVKLKNAGVPYVSSLASLNAEVAAPAINTTQVGDLVLGLFLAGGVSESTWDTPTGMTEVHDDNNAMACSYTPVSTGSTGAKSSDYNGFGANSFCAGLIAFHPATGPAVDEAAGFVLPDGTVSTDDISKATSWPAAGQVFTYGADDYNPDELDAADVNDTDFGWAHQASILDDGTAGIDYVEIVVRYNAALTIDLTTPADDGTGTVTQPNFTAAATFKLDGTTVTMNDTRWRIYSDAAGNNLVYDSGSIVSSATSHEIGSGTPTLPWSNALNDTTYYIRVTGTEDGTADADGSGDPIEGDSGLVAFTTSWTPPPAITGLTATAVTEDA